ncbi:hypothetical protein GCM10007049_13780 [Echinicola pacifica]|uniref:Por secretion system C-terminal sorting domain-containing protein n=1 Tax=Echinicola pacifica TaxID=346377 RepID=A0A918UNE6_9BACT|nr:T9SS type A sorting domain-containing protein [Echinicola pacifica]GGZ22241.1 hypothetical protein GCM10007049_13780 [Echinicola pacifica]
MIRVTLLFLVFTSLIQEHVFAQNYLYNSSNPGCTGVWTDGNCWTSSQIPGGCPVTNAFPPGNANCEVIITIPEDLSYPGSMDFPGNTSVFIDNDSKLVFTGDVSLSNGIALTIQMNSSNSTMDIGGAMRITGSSTFAVVGDPGRLPSEDITSIISAGNLFMGSRGSLTIDSNSGVLISGTTDIQTPGNNSLDKAVIDVDGSFITTSIIVRGNSDLEFRVSEEAMVIASDTDGTLEMNGNSSLTFIGDYDEGGDADGASVVEVGGQMDTNGSGASIMADDVTVYTCYSFPDGISTSVDHSGRFFEDQCILPVVWKDFSAVLKDDQKVHIRWSTTKEWESSHFEILRSLHFADDFKVIGKVEAVGWTDIGSEYFFEDASPWIGSRRYYQVRQVDLDGEEELTKVVSVKFNTLRMKNTCVLFPNPSHGNKLYIECHLEAFLGKPVHVYLYGGNSSTLLYDKQTVIYEQTIDLSDWNARLLPGIYIIHIRGENDNRVFKLIKR